MKGNSYSQNSEDLIISKYFGDYVGTLLDVGANDGITFSNSRHLIEKGWGAHLIEPAPTAWNLLFNRYEQNDKVHCHNCAIANDTGVFTLYESGAHVPNGKDVALVSTINQDELKRWPNVKFREVEIAALSFQNFMDIEGVRHFDFISIDCEGCDEEVLRQINLTAVGCKCLCIEWNSNGDLSRYYSEYCAHFGLKEIHRNAENIIFAR
jgi:FkbM family methyltransferase